MMYPSELPSDYDQYGFDRVELLEFLSTEGIHISEAFNASLAAKKSEVPEWAKLSKAIKQFTLHEAADILIGLDPWHQGWRDDDGEREFSRACATLKRAVGHGDLRPVSTDDRGHSSFNAQDLRAWAESAGLDWCIPSDAPVKAPAPAESATLDRLHQLEAANARLAEQVAELQRQAQGTEAERADQFAAIEMLQRQLAEATAAPQWAPQEAGPAPQQATAAPQDDDEKPLHRRERTTFLNIVGAMLDLLVSSGRWTSEASLIETLDAAYGKRGLKPRTLQAKFSEAKLSIKQD